MDQGEGQWETASINRAGSRRSGLRLRILQAGKLNHNAGQKNRMDGEEGITCLSLLKCALESVDLFFLTSQELAELLKLLPLQARGSLVHLVLKL